MGFEPLSAAGWFFFFFLSFCEVPAEVRLAPRRTVAKNIAAKARQPRRTRTPFMKFPQSKKSFTTSIIRLRGISLRARCAEQVHKKPIGARHTLRQLPEKGQAGVNVSSLADFRVNQRAIQIFFTGIMHGEQWRIFCRV